ncbi:MAG: hypothetical protein PF589_07270 [Gammaproteobacteria bacterium]|nr:hypothetical protein [Gammaproteobacteria bacterium]
MSLEFTHELYGFIGLLLPQGMCEGRYRAMLINSEQYLLICALYRAQSANYPLFCAGIAEITLEVLSEATNKTWVMGSERFEA